MCDVTSSVAVPASSPGGKVDGCFGMAGRRPTDFAASSPPHRTNGRPDPSQATLEAANSVAE